MLLSKTHLIKKYNFQQGLAQGRAVDQFVVLRGVFLESPAITGEQQLSETLSAREPQCPLPTREPRAEDITNDISPWRAIHLFTLSENGDASLSPQGRSFCESKTRQTASSHCVGE